MRYVLLVLAVLGIIASSLALREHYREYGDSPCSINDRWDCGVVNHRQSGFFAVSSAHREGHPRRLVRVLRNLTGDYLPDVPDEPGHRARAISKAAK